MKLARRALVAGLALALVALPACGGGGGGGESSGVVTLRPLGPPKTFDEDFARRLGPNGEASLDLAIATFESVFGPLPGTRVRKIQRPEQGEADVAVRLIRGYWDQLTDAQQRAAEHLLGEDQPPGGEVSNRGRSVPGGLGLAHLRALVADAHGKISDALGRTVPAPDVVVRQLRPDVAAWAEGLGPGGDIASSGPVTGCRIVANRDQAQLGVALAEVIAHEVFHCFQAALLPAEIYLYAGHGSLHAWVIEGQAEWAAEMLYPEAARRDMWDAWLSDPLYYGLFTRSYGAMGFWAALQQQGLDAWAVLDPTLRALAQTDDDDAAFAAATVGLGAAVLPGVSTAVSRIPTLGPDWEVAGPGMPGLVAGRSTTEIRLRPGEGASGLRGPIQPLAWGGVEADVAGDVLLVSSNAPVTTIGFPGGTRETFETAIHNRYCLRASCVCPNGTDPGLRVGRAGRVGIAIANPGPLAPNFEVVAKTERLADACTEPAGPATRDPAACLVGTWNMTEQVNLVLAAEVRLNLDTGGAALELGTDTYRQTFDGVEFRGSVDGGPGVGRVDTVTHSTGTADGSYSVSGPDTIEFVNEHVQGTITVTVTVQGQSSTSASPLVAASGAGQYECSNDALTLTFPNVIFRFQRA